MPFGNAQSLTDDEVYAITAYIMYSNDLVDDDFELSHENFQEVRLPNEANFFMDDREQSPVWTNREACMTDCKPAVEITMRAMVLDVTPEDENEGGDKAEVEAEVQVAAATTTEAPAPAPATPEPVEVALDADLVKAGEKVFKKCKACHQVGEGAKNKVGPILNGIVGAPLGAVEGFKYSKAIKAKAEEGAVWDDTNLSAFLEKPKKWLKGTKMSFGGLKKEKDRTAIVEFLKSHSQ